MLLHGDTSFKDPEYQIDLSDFPHLVSLPVLIMVHLPPPPQHLGIHIAYDSYHNMPYLINCDFESCIYKAMQQAKLPSMLNYLIVSVDSDEPISLQTTFQ